MKTRRQIELWPALPTGSAPTTTAEWRATFAEWLRNLNQWLKELEYRAELWAHQSQVEMSEPPAMGNYGALIRPQHWSEQTDDERAATRAKVEELRRDLSVCSEPITARPLDLTEPQTLFLWLDFIGEHPARRRAWKQWERTNGPTMQLEGTQPRTIEEFLSRGHHESLSHCGRKNL
jgi:hypothetical protein